jgi:excisionase family DNA binding protein
LPAETATAPADRRRLLPISEAADILGVSVRHLKRLYELGESEIAVERIGRKWLVNRAWVDAKTAWPRGEQS